MSDGDSELGEFVSIGGGQDKVSLDLGVDDLANGVLVGLQESKKTCSDGIR